MLMLAWPFSFLTCGWTVKENIFNSHWRKTDVEKQKLHRCPPGFYVCVGFLSLYHHVAGIASESANFSGSLDSLKLNRMWSLTGCVREQDNFRLFRFTYKNFIYYYSTTLQ